MEVKKLDIFESVIVGFLAFSFIQSTFSLAGTLPCLLFGVGVAAMFLIFYHEKYIGIVLNIGTSLLWSVIFTTVLSLFSLFNGRWFLLIPLAVAVFYVSLCIHGLNPWNLVSGGEYHIHVGDPTIKAVFDDFEASYEHYLKLKELTLPTINQALNDPAAGQAVKNSSVHFVSAMETIEKMHQEVSAFSGRKRISLKQFNYLDSSLKQIDALNQELSNLISVINDANEKKYEQSQQSGNIASGSADNTSYFNGCDSLESVKTRYRDLCKVYHPDMGNGSPEEFDKIQKEYNKLKERLS